MSFEITVDASDLDRMGDTFDPARIKAAAAEGFERGVAQLSAYIQQEKLSGQVLNIRSGRLSQAVGHPSVESGGDVMTAQIGGPFYGAVQEYGASINVNSPVNLPNIGWRYLKTVVLPARPWLMPSIEEKLSDIKDSIVEAINAA